MATLTAVDQTKICKVTNNTGSDIVVGLPVTTAESQNTGSTMSYNKDLEILAVSKGGNVIKAGDSDSVTLDRSHTDKSGTEHYSKSYDMLLMGASWFTPIANIGIGQKEDQNLEGYYPPQTGTADNKTAMQQTSDFYQTIAAYPDSQLAKDYVAAMSSATNNNDGNGISDGADDFFKNTKSYQKVTLEDIVFLEGIYNRLPFVWAQYNNSATYFLYSTDGKSTSFQGALSMTKAGNVDITKPNGGYICQFVPSVTPSDTSKIDVDSSRARSLTYSDGLFVDDLSSDMPGIALKGSFQLKRTFTKDPNDTKIIVVMTGTINSQVAIGFDQTQATKPDDSTQDWLNSLFHPKDAAGIFNSVMQILGALMMLHFVATTLYGIAKWIREKAAAKEPVTQEDLEAEKESAQVEFKARQEANIKKISADKVKLPDSAEEGLSKAATSNGNLSDEVSMGQARESIVKMNNNVSNLEEFVMDDYDGTMQAKINGVSDEMGTSIDTINNADYADLKATLAELRPQLQELSVKVTQLNVEIQNLVSQQQKAAMQDNVNNMKQVQDEVENEKQTNEEEGNDATNEDPEGEGLEFPIDL